ncbi:hypothetical protein BDW72DRAFT_197320 [Aspergillus terricola var. indicus]
MPSVSKFGLYPRDKALRPVTGRQFTTMKKLTRGQSYMLCQQRKVRCDQQKPCANCIRAQVECTVLPLVPPKPHKKKQSQLLDGALMDRLHRCETLLAQHGVDVGRALAAPSPRPSRETSTNTLPPLAYQATDELLRGSSDYEADQPAIHHDFDTMFDESDGFPFVVGGRIENLGSLHLPAIEILQLWQAQIVIAGARPTAIPKPLEALMFAIYLIAVHSMADDEVHDMFQEAKLRLLARYHHTIQQALINAAFMRATELSVLQAYLLYPFSISRSVDPRSLF